MRIRRVGVLFGGLSVQRAVSIRTGEAIHAALAARGHEAVRIFVDRDVDLALRQARIDVAFLALHGRWGEDGCIQGLLEMMGVPYTGSPVLASALAMNKVKAKEVFRLHNLSTPPYHVVRRGDSRPVREAHGAFGFPAVVKPCGEGSSVGLALADDVDELEAACEAALEHDDEILVERMVVGTEVSVALLDGRVLGALEVREATGATETAPARGAAVDPPPRLSRERLRGATTLALAAYRALGCAGAARVDLVVSEQGNEHLLEVDTTPVLTPESAYVRIAGASGLELGDVAEELLRGARLWAHGHGRHDRRVATTSYAGTDRRAPGALPRH